MLETSGHRVPRPAPTRSEATWVRIDPGQAPVQANCLRTLALVIDPADAGPQANFLRTSAVTGRVSHNGQGRWDRLAAFLHLSVIGEALSPEATPDRLASSAVQLAAWAEAASAAVSEVVGAVAVGAAAAADGDRTGNTDETKGVIW